VKSIGNVGAKSKEVYERLFSSTKPFIMEHPDYCIISAGINDAVAKLGSDYYVHHYMMIIHQLMELDIKPVLLEMPDVNYHAIAGHEQWIKRMRHILSSLITGSEMYGFDSYRTSLKQSIKQAGWQSKVVYISADTWNPDGYKDSRNLYMPDETHLNAMGYEILDSCIASVILRDIGENK
jgi:lysophospholipase L1-like esterase